MRCYLGYLADTAGTVEFWQKFLKPMLTVSPGRNHPVGVPGPARLSRVTVCDAGTLDTAGGW